MTAPRDDRSIFAALVSAQVFFGIFPALGKIALQSFAPLPFAFLRVAGASLLLSAVCRFGAAQKIERRDWPGIALLALLGVSINQIFFIEGLSRSTAINAALLMTTIPVLTLGIAILAGREEPSFRKIAGCGLAVSGALTLLGVARFQWRSTLFLGDVLLLTNALAYSLYLVLSRDLLRKYSALNLTRVTFLAGALPIFAVSAPGLARMRVSNVSALAWACLAAVIVFPSVLAYVLNAWALARTHASHVALFVTVQPVVAALLAIPLLHETITLSTAGAAALIVAGLFLSGGRSGWLNEPASD